MYPVDPDQIPVVACPACGEKAAGGKIFAAEGELGSHRAIAFLGTRSGP